MKEKEVILTIMIDALRFDFIDKYKPKFLSSLLPNSLYKDISEPLTFETRPAYFAGIYPDKSNIANQFWLDARSSPFFFVKFLPNKVLELLSNKSRFIDKIIRIIIDFFAKKIEKIRGNSASQYYINSHKIPYHLLNLFDVAEKKLSYESDSLPYQTIFDILRENKKKFLWIAYPTDNLTTNGILSKFRSIDKITNYDFIFLHFGEIDWLGHIFGPESDKIGEKLFEIDKAIHIIYKNLTSDGIKIKFILFGDHGMVNVNKSISLFSVLNSRGIQITNKDIYFLDSIMFRYWNNDEKKFENIKNYLDNLEFGTVLHKEKIKELHYNFPHNKYGDLIFLLKPGYIFFPNFFQNSSMPRGMHGYGPDCKDNNGFLLLYWNKIKEQYTLNSKKDDLTSLFSVFVELFKKLNYKHIKNNPKKNMLIKK